MWNTQNTGCLGLIIKRFQNTYTRNNIRNKVPIVHSACWNNVSMTMQCYNITSMMKEFCSYTGYVLAGSEYSRTDCGQKFYSPCSSELSALHNLTSWHYHNQLLWSLFSPFRCSFTLITLCLPSAC